MRKGFYKKFKPYPLYEPVGINWLGQIPKHWAVFRFKNIAHLAYGDSLPAENRDEGHIEVFGSNGPVGMHTRANTLAPVLIIGRKGSYGKINYHDNGVFAIDTTYFIDKRTTSMNLRWLFYLIGILGLDSYSEDSAVPGLSRNYVYSHYLPIPSSLEQQFIALFLDRETAKIDALIEKKERLIELLQEKRSALISHAVTKGLPAAAAAQAGLDPTVPMKDSGVEWIGEIPAHWNVMALKYATAARKGAVKTGPFGSQLLSSEMISGEIKVYNQRNVIDRDFKSGENYVTKKRFAELKEFSIFPDDVLITTRGTISQCAVFPLDAEMGILHPCLIRVQPNPKSMIPEYLALVIQDNQIVKLQLLLMSNATTIDVIYSDSLKNVKLSLPPVREQEEILDYIQSVNKKISMLITKTKESITFFKEYRTALISAVVTGKIDVREETI